jgi:prepilin-type N-terminal cleavage/methylation domain-containing protein
MHCYQKLSPHASRRGFSLVELLIVLVLLGALLALVVHLARGSDVKRKLTRVQQFQLTIAIQEHFGRLGFYPPSEGSAPTPQSIARRSSGLVDALYTDTNVAYMLDDLPKGTIIGRSGSNPGMVYDAFGNPMDYQVEGGTGGTPVLISGGADGYIGGDHAKDDIRSDEQ